MIDGTTDNPPLHAGASQHSREADFGRWRMFAGVTLGLTLAFAISLYRLILHSLDQSIHSHLLLIPFISGYFAWQSRGAFARPEAPGKAQALLGGLLTLLGAGAMVFYFFNGSVLSHNDQLSVSTFAYVAFLAAAALLLLGGPVSRQLSFPLAFLIFFIPLPDRVLDLLEIASQHASAEVYSWMMNLSGATYYREARTFVLPNLTIVVAQECSGIRSSLVLFIVSVVAGQMFFRRTMSKWILAFAVFPLGIARNAFRIYLLSMASAHWNPDIIHSPLHHRGGPIFFVLSLIPFFALLFWLRKRERTPENNKQ